MISLQNKAGRADAPLFLLQKLGTSNLLWYNKSKRKASEITCTEMLAPKEHPLRKIDVTVNFSTERVLYVK